MKLEYKDGEFIDSDKHPYDSAAIFEELKKLGVGKVTIRRTDRLIIETDKDLTDPQKATLKAYLDTIDITKSIQKDEVDIIES